MSAVSHEYVIDRGAAGTLTVEADCYKQEGDFVTFLRDLNDDTHEQVASFRAADVLSVRERLEKVTETGSDS